MWPGVVANAYNPSYLRGRDKRVEVRARPGKKVSKPITKNKLGEVTRSIIPAMQEAKVGGLCLRSAPGKK
jgi:hypothetical protein